MDINRLTQVTEYSWRIEAEGAMRVSAIIYADKPLIEAMDEKVFQQAANVAMLPGIIGPVYAMPDAHWGYGFPIGGVAAFDPAEGGVVSAGGVGFDISCGVRTLHTGLKHEAIAPYQEALAEQLFAKIPAGLGSRGTIHLDDHEMDRMLSDGALWAVSRGYGTPDDLLRMEEGGRMENANPAAVSPAAHRRQRDEMGTLGSGNHYLEVQKVAEVYDNSASCNFGIAPGDILLSIHSGSRGLGHQIGTEYLKHMLLASKDYGIVLPDRELACAPIDSPLGQSYLGAMRAAINCALSNRQIITHLTRQVFKELIPQAQLDILYDVSHNTCKVEDHSIDGKTRRLYVHRKGATRAFGPGHADLPDAYREVGQPVLIGGSMGTASYILAGTTQAEQLSLASACHGAGRSMSRHQATRTWKGRQIIDELARQGVIVRSLSYRGVAEEAPGAYKDVNAVIEAAHRAGLARKVARLTPLICIKG